MWSRYFESSDRGSAEDYRIRLLHREDVMKVFASPAHEFEWTIARHRYPGRMPDDEKARFERLGEKVRSLKPGQYWCIAACSGQRLEVLWFFHTEVELFDQWVDLR
jgi:hypothetical protein